MSSDIAQSLFIDLLMVLFRGAVFRHVNGPFSGLNGAFPRFRPKGPFYLLKIYSETLLENSP